MIEVGKTIVQGPNTATFTLNLQGSLSAVLMVGGRISGTTASIFGVSDNAGGTWTQINYMDDTQNIHQGSLWKGVNLTDGATVTISSDRTCLSLIGIANGFPDANPTLVTAAAESTTDTAAPTVNVNVTDATATDFIVGVSRAADLIPATGWTSTQTNYSIVVADASVSYGWGAKANTSLPTGSQAFGGTLSSARDWIIFGISASASAPTTVNVSGSENPAISIADTRAQLVTQTRPDTAAVTITESRVLSSSSPVPGSTSTALTITETSVVNIITSTVASQSNSLTITEGSSVTIDSTNSTTFPNFAQVVVRDSPVGLFMLDTPVNNDLSGYGRTATISSSVYALSLVAGAVNSRVLSNSSQATLSVPVFNQGAESQQFSLEAWAKSVQTSTDTLGASAEQQILGNNGQMDGLTINGTVVSFVTKYLTAGEARASYDLQINRAFQAIGIHSSSKNQLYIDGVLVSEVDITDAQKADKFVATNGNLYSGASLSSRKLEVNGVCMFYGSLSEVNIRKHFSAGRDIILSNDVPFQFGGVNVLLSQIDTNVFVSQTWSTSDEWYSGQNIDTTIENERLSPSLSNGISLPGTWLTSVALTSNATSVYGLVVDWDGIGAVVETSLDGITWETVTRANKITSIANGFDPTDKVLNIRVTFPGGITSDQSYMDNLTIVGLISNVVLQESNMPVTYNGATTPLHEYEPVEMRDDWGVNLPGGYIRVGADTADDPISPKTIEIWLKPTDATSSYTILDWRTASTTTAPYLVLNYPGAAYNSQGASVYLNGSPGAVLPRIGEWSVLHVVTSVTSPSDILLNSNYLLSGQGNLMIGKIAVYNKSLSATDIDNIYKSYTGRRKQLVADVSSISISNPTNSVTSYSQDWQITPAG